ncbi:hypothetical protein BJ508DRAFT_160062 [Ascobolus immersus RN42]|uniref:Uncharacterized protein n=1 Tax=Ascobolus immersus RN42 TaxID=1160509 RepID=A0A3N4HYF0_ASCIM|nr:hypothetical protein BJ508DRAFT_160062 [Ascobolus immersus RN42]
MDTFQQSFHFLGLPLSFKSPYTSIMDTDNSKLEEGPSSSEVAATGLPSTLSSTSSRSLSPSSTSLDPELASEHGSPPGDNANPLDNLIADLPNWIILTDAALNLFDRTYPVHKSGNQTVHNADGQPRKISDIQTDLVPMFLMQRKIPYEVVKRIMEDRLLRRTVELFGSLDLEQLKSLMKSSWAPEWEAVRLKEGRLAQIFKGEILAYLYLIDSGDPNSMINRWSYGAGNRKDRRKDL